jgi:hypothetical protein
MRGRATAAICAWFVQGWHFCLPRDSRKTSAGGYFEMGTGLAAGYVLAKLGCSSDERRPSC